MSKKLEKPAMSFEVVCQWFEKSATNAASQDRYDSATLWRDGLEHLKYWHNLAMQNPKNKGKG